MEFIQTDLNKADLAASIQSNLQAFLVQFGKKQPQPIPGILCWQTAIQHPWFNGVLIERAPEPEDENLIRELSNFFQARGIRSWSWWVGQPSNPGEWADLLGKAGFQYEKATPGMAMTLDNLSDQALAVPGLTIRTVATLPELKTWCRVFAVGYGLPPEWADPFFELMSGFGFDLPVRNYLGEWNGKPVAASTLFLADGVAGIYDVATLPEARRKGIGAAMTIAPLLEARQMGYQAAILQSSQAGYGVYRKLGFEQLCEIEMFVWDE